MPHDIRTFFGGKGSQGTPSSQEKHSKTVEDVRFPTKTAATEIFQAIGLEGVFYLTPPCCHLYFGHRNPLYRLTVKMLTRVQAKQRKVKGRGKVELKLRGR